MSGRRSLTHRSGAKEGTEKKKKKKDRKHGGESGSDHSYHKRSKRRKSDHGSSKHDKTKRHRKHTHDHHSDRHSHRDAKDNATMASGGDVMFDFQKKAKPTKSNSGEGGKEKLLGTGGRSDLLGHSGPPHLGLGDVTALVQSRSGPASLSARGSVHQADQASHPMSEPRAGGMSAGSKGAMRPEEYQKLYNTVTEVLDPDTGRMRLQRATGEVLEQIVSREKQRELQQTATHWQWYGPTVPDKTRW